MGKHQQREERLARFADRITRSLGTAEVAADKELADRMPNLNFTAVLASGTSAIAAPTKRSAGAAIGSARREIVTALQKLSTDLFVARVVTENADGVTARYRVGRSGGLSISNGA